MLAVARLALFGLVLVLGYNAWLRYNYRPGLATAQSILEAIRLADEANAAKTAEVQAIIDEAKKSNKPVDIEKLRKILKPIAEGTQKLQRLESELGVSARAAALAANIPTRDGAENCGKIYILDHKKLSLNNLWHNTGCDLEPRGFVDFRVVEDTMANFGHPPCGPEGCPQRQGQYTGKLLCDDLPYMAVIGRVNGTCFLIGAEERIHVSQFGLGRVEISRNQVMVKADGVTRADSEWREIIGNLKYYIE